MRRRMVLMTFLACAAATVAQARILSREEALHAAFPGAEIRQSMIFLTDSEMQAAGRLAGNPIPSALIARYDAVRDGIAQGTAYLDTHVVRTKKESLLILIDTTGRLLRVEVVAFLEPPDYMPPDRWYRQFDGHALDDDLQLKRGIHPVTGATLTAQSTTEAARRALAIDQVLRHRMEKKP